MIRFLLIILALQFPAAWAKPNCELALVRGLHRANPEAFTISRVRRGKGFSYFIDERKISRAAELERLSSLGVRPDLREVHINPDPLGHIQAVGIDEAGRTQYVYHPRWIEMRARQKFSRMVDFGEALPRIRAQVGRDMREAGVSKTKVLALAVHLLETTLIRVGNREFAEENHTYGLTTLRKSHVKVTGSKLTFSFTGKSNQPHVIEKNDARLARLIGELLDISGTDLLQYDAGTAVSSADVNEYIKDISGADISAKDFRTWGANVTALEFLEANPKATPSEISEAVAEALGNTPSVAAKSYIAPVVLKDTQRVADAISEARRLRSDRPLAERALLILLRP